MRSTTSDQNAVSVTWASTSTMKELSWRASLAAWARISRVSVEVLIFGSSVTREMPLPFFPLRGVLVSIDVLHPRSGFCDRAGESRPLESAGKLAAIARDGHGK